MASSLPPPADDTWLRGLAPWKTEVLRWAVQTVCSAMVERGKSLGKDMQDRRRVMLVGNEGLRLIREMWDFAISEAQNPEDDGEMTARMGHLVLHWTVEHLRDGEPGHGYEMWKKSRG